MSNVLVISPHPDDESIGCGGTIKKHVLDGDTVEVIFLTSGEKGGHYGVSEEEALKIREKEAVAAAGILKISKFDFWRETDGNLQVTDVIVKRMIEKISTFKPDFIYVTHEQEHHPDHRTAAQIIRRAVSLLPETTKKPIVWTFEVWTPLQTMDHIVDISPYVDDKRRAILAYKSQCDVVKFDEAILGLNRHRGELYNWGGGDFAEIFTKMS